MRDTYGATMIKMVAEDARVVALDADLVSPIGMTKFQLQFPNRMIDCGIQEANMTGVAAGMSARGLIPFMHTFSSFASRKCVDQLFLSAGFAQLNVKVIGSDPGMLALYNGASHMGLEDMGVLGNIPNITLLEPSDPVMLEALLRKMKDTYGVHYLRMNRKEAFPIYAEGSDFEIGKGLVLEEGKDATIIASGMMVKESIDAAEALKEEGYSVRVVDMFTWKPIDEELVIDCAKTTGAIVTAENHNVSYGLGSAVARVIGETYPVPHLRIGINGTFGEVGDKKYLMERFKLRAEDIAEKVRKAIGMKTKA